MARLLASIGSRPIRINQVTFIDLIMPLVIHGVFLHLRLLNLTYPTKKKKKTN